MNILCKVYFLYYIILIDWILHFVVINNLFDLKLLVFSDCTIIIDNYMVPLYRSVQIPHIQLKKSTEAF